jgi:hypothetical protein
VADTIEFSQTGGEAPLMISSWRLGSVNQFITEAYPTFDYGPQRTLSPPTVKSAVFTYGTARSFQTLPIVITNDVQEFPASNLSGGIRLDPQGRTITANGSLLMDDADILMEYDELTRTDSSFAGATWDYGDGDSAAGGYNQIDFSCTDLLVDSLTYDRAGSLITAEIESHCIGTTAGGEFAITFS